MHIVVLLLVIFLRDQPAANGQPAVPAHAESKSYVLAGDAVDSCPSVGPAMVSQLVQDPLVSHAGFACIPVNNPEDKAT